MERRIGATHAVQQYFVYLLFNVGSHCRTSVIGIGCGQHSQVHRGAGCKLSTASKYKQDDHRQLLRPVLFTGVALA